jgi:FMN phosphatase YigB (HAD superfamily)
MLDMGGMPSASTDRTLIRTANASKNSKLQAVAFDFQALLKGNHSVNNSAAAEKSNPQQSTPLVTRTDSKSARASPKEPDADWSAIQEVAALLKVELPSGKRKNDADIPSKKVTLAQTAPHEDVRAKYARKIQGGLAGLELAKSQVHDSLARGDAAGHQVARKLAMESPMDESKVVGSKWISPPETARLLSLLTHRSIRIALLPHPPMVNNRQSQEEEEQSMRILAAQLRDVVVDVIVPGLVGSDGDALKDILRRNVLNELQMDPHRVLMVTDRDDYIRAARDLGMQTCRLQPKNARRGNVSADFTATAIEDVQEVVNEINGISFNVVLNRC